MLDPSATGQVPVPFQRVAVYARCVAGDRVLLTRHSGRSPVPGRWGLPGGGIQHGEHPRDALVRELYEETGYRVEPGPVVGVTNVYFQGVSPSGRLEDFHSVGIVFEVDADAGQLPQVVLQGETTDHAQWVPFAEIACSAVVLTDSARQGLNGVPGLEVPS